MNVHVPFFVVGLHFQIPKAATVSAVKKILEGKTGTPPERQILVYMGKRMADTAILSGETSCTDLRYKLYATPQH